MAVLGATLVDILLHGSYLLAELGWNFVFLAFVWILRNLTTNQIPNPTPHIKWFNVGKLAAVVCRRIWRSHVVLHGKCHHPRPLQIHSPIHPFPTFSREVLLYEGTFFSFFVFCAIEINPRISTQTIITCIMIVILALAERVAADFEVKHVLVNSIVICF